MRKQFRPIRLFLPIGALAVLLSIAAPPPARAQTFSPSVRLTEAGWSEPVGTWDPVARVAVLTRQVTSTIEVEADALVLDGGGYDVWGTSAVGVYVHGRSDVTIRNLPVGPFQTGVLFEDSTRSSFVQGESLATVTGVRVVGGSGNSVSGNSFVWPGHGEIVAVEASGTTGVTIDGNTASYASIRLYSSVDATVSYNTVDNAAAGIYLYRTTASRVTGNAASRSQRGIALYYSDDNRIDRNVLRNDRLAGLLLSSSARNTATDNLISGSELSGVYMENANDNRFYHNNMVGNWAWQAYVVGGAGNVFNLPKPQGGNHWSDWTTPDADGDGFVDLPYGFAGGSDALPFTAPDGWLAVRDTTPPTTSASVQPGSPDGYNSWYVSPPSVTLVATDTESPVAATYYRWDDGTDAPYQGPLTAPEGVHTLRFHSVDAAGNAETERSVTIKLDTVAPPPPVILAPQSGSSVDDSVTVSGTAEPGSLLVVFEGESLLATTTADAAGQWSTPQLTLAEGEHTIVVAAADEAGNMLIPSTVVTFARRATSLPFSATTPSAGRFGEAVRLSARLSASIGPVAGRDVEFRLAGQTFPTVTDAEGEADVTVALDQRPGEYPLEVRFSGDRELKPAATLTTFEVLPRATTLAYLDGTRFPVGGTSRLVARLSDADTGPAPAGRTVRFTFGSQTATATTDGDGVATAEVTLTQSPGLYEVLAAFEGDAWYTASSSPATGFVVYDPYSGQRVSGTAVVEQGTGTAKVKIAASYPFGSATPSGSLVYAGRDGGPSCMSTGLSYLLFLDSTVLAGSCTHNGVPGYGFTATSTRAEGVETFSLTVRDAAGTVVFENTGSVLQGGLRVRDRTTASRSGSGPHAPR